MHISFRLTGVCIGWDIGNCVHWINALSPSHTKKQLYQFLDFFRSIVFCVEKYEYRYSQVWWNRKTLNVGNDIEALANVYAWNTHFHWVQFRWNTTNRFWIVNGISNSRVYVRSSSSFNEHNCVNEYCLELRTIQSTPFVQIETNLSRRRSILSLSLFQSICLHFEM